MISFEKYHGTGNDFILIDDRKSELNLDTETIRLMCDRHFGIGADGLIQIRNHDNYDFEMLYYNSNGLKGSMCGNGGRCAAAFAHSHGMIKETTSFLAFDGVHKAIMVNSEPYLVKLQMSDVKDIEKHPDFILLDTGSPHYVIFTRGVRQIDVKSEGQKIRYSEPFKKDGVNVNFVENEDKQLYMRTYERGVEDETLSCGTGVTAAVLASSFTGRILESEYNVSTPGGNLKVYFTRNGNVFSDVWLEGNARYVFSGEFHT